jgi:hypothetical protein
MHLLAHFKDNQPPQNSARPYLRNRQIEEAM